MKRNSAFTLIELLVVIAIIAILAAILFPVFAQAKIAAKKSQTISNVKQIGTGIHMYLSDYDDMYPQAEYGGGGSGAPLISWYTQVYPYIKNGDYDLDSSGTRVSWGKTGIFRSPLYPQQPIANPANDGQRQRGGFSYGANMSIFANNYENNGQTPNGTVTSTAIENVAEKVIVLEKGANYSDWGYPWFHPHQQFWVGSIATAANDESAVVRDGVDVYPGQPRYDPRYDTDCTSATDGAWECAAHPRYRFSQGAPFLYADGHAKIMKRGAVQWYKNIFFNRRGYANDFSWYYGYIKGEWGPWLY